MGKTRFERWALRLGVLAALALSIAGIAAHRNPGSDFAGQGWTHGASAPMAPPANGSWAQTFWAIDPANSSGVASDQNTGLSTSAPLVHLAEVYRRYGTLQPFLSGASTTFQFMSSQPDTTDAWLLNPITVGPVILRGDQNKTEISGSPFAVAGLVPFSRASGQLLQVTAWTGAAVSQLVQNTTHNSLAWVLTVSGGVATLSNPMNVAPTPPTPYSPATLSSWANTDTIHVYTPLNIAIGVAKMQVPNFIAASHNSLYVYQLTAIDPLGGAITFVGESVIFQESQVHQTMVIDPNVTNIGAQFNNCHLVSIQGGPEFRLNNNFQTLSIVRGGDFLNLYGGMVNLSTDTILLGPGNGGVSFHAMTGGLLSNVVVDNGTTLFVHGQTKVNGQVWGLGTLAARAEIAYNAPASSAFTVATLNTDPNTANAFGLSVSGGVATLTQFLLTPANLDSGVAFNGLAIGLTTGGIFRAGNQ